jgi:zinc D-Ala-D-Ala carboxypeptidase
MFFLRNFRAFSRSRVLPVLIMTLLGFGLAFSGNAIPSKLEQSSAADLLTPPSVTPSVTASPLPVTRPSKLGHFPYLEADEKTLMVVGRYGSRVEKLAPEVAEAWKTMVNAAKQESVSIVPISGFRSVKTQTWLFSDRSRRRGVEAAARSVAPPGYSEHHTGYAIDIGDARAPGRDITPGFANTNAFRWMAKNARKYGFEISFPPNNRQRVMYEPWHWRYIGSPAAEQLFATARSQKS